MAGLAKGTPAAMAQAPPSVFHYSYRISTDGTNYYVKDADGNLDFTETNYLSAVQDAVNALTSGGAIYHDLHICKIPEGAANGVVLPFGLSYYFYGQGIPSYPYPFTPKTYATPSDGTQIRAPVSWLSNGQSNSIFLREAGTGVTGYGATGVLAFFNMGIMPPWGTCSNGSVIYGINDIYSAIYIEDNLLWAPWGWTEAGMPAPSPTKQAMIPQNIGPNVGGGTGARIGSIIQMGMGQPSWVHFVDSLAIDRLSIYDCYQGLICSSIWSNQIKEIYAYAVKDFHVKFWTEHQNYVQAISVEQPIGGIVPDVPYLFYLGASNTGLKVGYVYIWGSGNTYPYTSITNNDAQLEGSTLVFGMGNAGTSNSGPQKGYLQRFGPSLITPPANPLVSGTVYRNLASSDIDAHVPVAFGTLGTVVVTIGPTSTPAWVLPAETRSNETSNVKFSVPVGWYYMVTVSGSASIQSGTVLISR